LFVTRWPVTDFCDRLYYNFPMKNIALVVLILLIIYLLAFVFIYVFQRCLVFNPQKGSSSPPEDLNIRELWITTKDGQKLHAWWMPSELAEYTVLFFHGNAGNISRGEKRMRLFREMGCNAFAVEYRGYGISTGKIKKEEDVFADADASWEYLITKLGIPEEKIIIWGWSMGGAVAVNLAQQKNCHALVMESTFYSLADMAPGYFLLFPKKLLMRYYFKSGEKLSNIKVPVLFIHSRTDETVPYTQGVRLYETFSGTKKFMEITGDHNHGVFDSQEKFLPEAMQFLRL